jgi:DcaP outer membrane protein
MRRKYLHVVLACCFGGSAFAQNQSAQSQASQTQSVQPTSTDQQLRDKVQRLEQLTQELKARLAELEKSRDGTPRVVDATTTVSGQPSTVNRDAPAPHTKEASPAAAISVASPAATKPQDAPPQPAPPEEKPSKPEMEIYGHAMLDLGYDFGQINPNWFDVERPTQLPAVQNEFGQNGRLFTGVRQTRFGVKNLFPTKYGELKTVFEFELFGVGIDAGQTTFRLRQAYGEIGQLLAGQTWSPFMDPDVFPNSIEYWGPNGMVFFRNVQLRWQPINNGNKQVMIALERPGATADLGTVQDRDILQGVQFRFPAPDISGHVRYGGKRTYIQLSGMFRYIAWDDNAPTAITNLTGHTYGWGAHVSSNVGVGEKDTIKWSVIYGDGVENYMNDAPVDIGPKARLFDIHRPITGEPLPVFGAVAFYDHYWNEKFSSTIGASVVNITNTPLLTPDAFRRGWYGVTDLLYYPVKNVMLGGEFIWGRRDNFTDGFTFDDYRIQFSFKYNFSFKLLGGNK